MFLVLCSPRKRKSFLNVGKVLPVDTALCPRRVECSPYVYIEARMATVCFVDERTDLIWDVIRLLISARRIRSVRLFTSFV